MLGPDNNQGAEFLLTALPTPKIRRRAVVPSNLGPSPRMVGTAPAPGADSQNRTTTFLLSNLHCDSCVSSIRYALSRLVPRPSSVDLSIMYQTVTVRHHPSLPESTLSKALDEAGFEIYDVVRDTETGYNTGDGTRNERALTEQDGWIDRAVERWSRSYKSANQSEKKRIARHIEGCDVCRAEKGAKSDDKVHSASTIEQGKSFAMKYNGGNPTAIETKIFT